MSDTNTTSPEVKENEVKIVMGKFKLGSLNGQKLDHYHCSLNEKMVTIDINMSPGKVYEMPSANQHVKNLVEKGILEVVSSAKEKTK